MATTNQNEPLEELRGSGEYEPLEDLGDSVQYRAPQSATTATKATFDDAVVDVPVAAAPGGGDVAARRTGGGRFAVFVLVLLLVVSLAGLIGLLSVEAQRSAVQAGQVEVSSRLLMLSQRISRLAREATLGDTDAFTGLDDSRASVEAILAALDRGDPVANVAVLGAASRPAFNSLRETWEPLRGNAETVVRNRAAILNVGEARDTINELVPLLLAQSDEVVEAMVLENADPTLLNLAGRQRTLTQRIRAAVNEFALGESGAAVAATQFGRDLRLYGRTVRLLEADLPGAFGGGGADSFQRGGVLRSAGGSGEYQHRCRSTPRPVAAARAIDLLARAGAGS